MAAIIPYKEIPLAVVTGEELPPELNPGEEIPVALYSTHGDDLQLVETKDDHVPASE